LSDNGTRDCSTYQPGISRAQRASVALTSPQVADGGIRLERGTVDDLPTRKVESGHRPDMIVLLLKEWHVGSDEIIGSDVGEC